MFGGVMKNKSGYISRSGLDTVHFTALDIIMTQCAHRPLCGLCVGTDCLHVIMSFAKLCILYCLEFHLCFSAVPRSLAEFGTKQMTERTWYSSSMQSL